MGISSWSYIASCELFESNIFIIAILDISILEIYRINIYVHKSVNWSMLAFCGYCNETYLQEQALHNLHNV